MNKVAIGKQRVKSSLVLRKVSGRAAPRVPREQSSAPTSQSATEKPTAAGGLVATKTAAQGKRTFPIVALGASAGGLEAR